MVALKFNKCYVNVAVFGFLCPARLNKSAMAELARIGIAIPEDLLREFDRLIELRGYSKPL